MAWPVGQSKIIQLNRIENSFLFLLTFHWGVIDGHGGLMNMGMDMSINAYGKYTRAWAQGVTSSLET